MKIEKLQNVMVSISVLKQMAGDLVKAGFTRVYRTRAEQERLTALYTTKAAEKTPSLDVGRLGRTDAAGNQQVDGGYLIFTADGQKMVMPMSLIDDLLKAGFHLAVAEVFEKEGDDRNIRLRITWSRNSASDIMLTEHQEKIALKYFDQTYWKLFGFFNPRSIDLAGDQCPIQGSIVTLNFSGAMKPDQVKTCTGNIREVRMTDADGHLACPLKNPDGKTPQRCPERTPDRFLAQASPAEAFDRGIAGK